MKHLSVLNNLSSYKTLEGVMNNINEIAVKELKYYLEHEIFVPHKGISEFRNGDHYIFGFFKTNEEFLSWKSQQSNLPRWINESQDLLEFLNWKVKIDCWKGKMLDLGLYDIIKSKVKHFKT